MSKSVRIASTFFFLFFLGCFYLSPAWAQNAIQTENAKTGNSAEEWEISGAGDLSIQGFATDISYNKGQTAIFKIKTDATSYTVKIYRLGYYQGDGARWVGTATVSANLPQTQPTCRTNAETGLVDCGNWAESAQWAIPSSAVSGIYLAKLTRAGGGSSHIAFVVRDDASDSDLLFQTSDATWQAYNVYGDNNNGKSLYSGAGGKASKVSYNRPFYTRAGGGGGGPEEDWLFNAEYPMLRFLEKNGYDVTYTTNVDTERRGELIKKHRSFLSVGHDEYWSKGMRDHVTTARNGGTHLAFFSGNEVYWKVRWENSIDGSGTTHRTLVCYKEGRSGENQCNGKCDTSTNEWTGLWRSGCEYPESDGCNPENELTGQVSWDGTTSTMQVSSDYKNLRFWRNTGVASLANGQSLPLTPNSLGYEWNPEQEAYRATYPAGRILLSRTVHNGKTHHLTLYKHSSGALVFGAGTVQWAWGLDNNHDRGSEPVSPAMQQATVNLFADMGVQPTTLQPNLSPAAVSMDATAPTLTVTSPREGASVPGGTAVIITGTAADANTVAGVEVSTDNGISWRLATGTTNWSFAWTPATAGAAKIISRAFDDSGNISATTTVNVTVTAQACPCTVFSPTDAPSGNLNNDRNPLVGIQLGMKFRATTAGFVTGARFYKQSGNTGTHTGQLYSNTGTLLAQATFTNETASGWQEVLFDAPIAVTANTTYIISYHSSAGHYSLVNPFFDVAKVNGPLQALADSEAEPNGLYKYSTAPTFPNDNFGSSNYFVDVVFTTESNSTDTTPPTVTATSPVDDAVKVNETGKVSVTFSEAIDPSTITSATFRLLKAGSPVTASVSYNATSRTATLDPGAALSYATTYTAEVKGGSSGSRVTDAAGNALAATRTWSFTTRAAPLTLPSPTEGPGGPILVISSPANPFSRYPVEILRAEGLNEFAAKNIADVTATVLESYDVVIVGDIALTSTQVTMLTNWVNAGGTLIAFKPDTELAALLGLTRVSGTLSDQYIKVNTANGPGKGIVTETIQFHGSADLYTLNGATSLATLYTSATTATSNPAVTSRNVGTNGGKAIAFTYDLARSVVYTRQGNPAWAGQSKDGQAGPIRSDNLFFPDWIDFNKVAIPQADEQQRLLANIILQSNLHKKPLPRFWYLPRGLKAAVIMTGDDHGNGGTIGRFNDYLAKSSANTPQAVANWTAIRGTSYIYPNTPISDAQAKAFEDQGFEIALHLNTNCANYTFSSLNNFFDDQLAQLAAKFPSISPSATHRTHCIAWSDWASKPKVELTKGIRLDTDYYYWPGSWVNDRPGMFTGSGIPMRFADLDGTLIDVYQATTQLTDESGITYATHIKTLLDNALGTPGYYGVFTANMHTDQNGGESTNGSNAIIAYAEQKQVPVISAKQMLTWLDGRNNSSFDAVSWSSNKLNFRITAADGATNLRAMLPINGEGGQLTGLTVNGSVVNYTTETVKGMLYAFFPATDGSYVATYDIDNAAPQITAVTTTQPNAGVANIKWTTNEAADSKVVYGTAANQLTTTEANATLVTAHTITLSGLAPGTTYYYRVTSVDAAGNSVTEPNPSTAPKSFRTPAAACFADQTAANFDAGTAGASTYVTSDGVILKPQIAEEFTSLPPTSEWQSFPWGANGTSTVANGQVTVDGARYNTEPESKTYGPGTAIEFTATFEATPFQHLGFGAGNDVDMFNNTLIWAMFSTGTVGTGLQARVRSGGTVVDFNIPGNFLGTPHRYRITWQTSSIEFYIDGTLVHTQNTSLTTPMRVGVSDYTVGGPAVNLDWLRITPYAATGSFTSRVYDGGQLKTWHEATWRAELPAGTAVKLFQRQGNSPTPDDSWTAFKAIAASGDEVGGTSRYIQYRADLTSSSPDLTPVLQSVAIGCAEPACPALAFTPGTGTALPAATVGTAYSQTISTSPAGYTFTATGLPAGLAINGASGVISGTPTAAGTNSITVTATQGACAESATYTLVVESAATPTYSLTTATTGNGTVIRNPNQTSYASGSTVTLTATPASGFQFSGWSGDATGTVNPLTVTMNGNKNITATFTAVPAGQQVVSFTLINATTDQPIRNLVPGDVVNLAAGSNLNIRANTNPVTVGSVKMALSGKQVQSITETAAPYALFGDVSGNYKNWTPAVGSYTLTATPYTAASGGGTAGTPLTINFSVVNQPTTTQYSLTITAANGTVTRSPNQSSYASGSTVTLTATPNSGYQFTGWSGDATGTTNPLTVTMNSNKSITANFALVSTQYTLTVTTSGSGTVTRSPNQTSYAGGSTVTLTATPAAGFQFSGWSGSATGTSNPLTVTMNSNKNITATFTAVPVGQRVVSFTLINATTDQPIQNLVPGETLNLATLPTRNLNIRANTNPVTVGSVKMALNTSSGTLVKSITETSAPYALFGDVSGNYNNWTPAVGSYTLTATPYTAASGGGTAGTALTISFRVINQATAASDPAVFTEVAAPAGASGQVTVYPIPTTNGQLAVKLTAALTGEVTYTLVSAIGVKLAAGKINLPQPTSEVAFDFSQQMRATGAYYLLLEGQALQIRLKVMRQ